MPHPVFFIVNCEEGKNIFRVAKLIKSRSQNFRLFKYAWHSV